MEKYEHIVYILKCKDNTLYTGYTNNLENRLKLHENGKGAKYTRGRGPFQVVFTKKFPSKQQAMQKEYQIKQLTRKEKELLINMNREEVCLNEHSKEL